VGTREEKDIADGLGAFMGAGGASVGDGVQVWLVLGWGLVGNAVGLSWDLGGFSTWRHPRGHFFALALSDTKIPLHTIQWTKFDESKCTPPSPPHRRRPPR
jgi:hypothetical protein